MSDVWRAFMGVHIPATPALRKLLVRLTTAGGRLSPISPDRLHVTLKFLGDVSTDLIPEVGQVLAGIVESHPIHEVDLFGLGAFPNVQRPAVVWVGFRGAEQLAHLAAELEAALEPLGFPPEGRAFHPHLTLLRMRARPPEEVFRCLREHAGTDFGRVSIDAVELFRSELLPTGSRYTVLSRAPLSPAR